MAQTPQPSTASTTPPTHGEPLPTRTRILEAARRLFHEQGYAATGIATILREADVNSGSLYHYFPSKEALLAGVLEHYVELLRPVVIGPAEEREQDAIERVFNLLAWYRHGLELTRCTMGCPVGNLALEVADSHPEVRPLIDLNFRNWVSAVESWLAAAGDRLPAACNRRQLAQLVLTVMEGGIMQSRAASTLEPYDASVAQLRTYFDLLQEEARKAAPQTHPH
ncbi:MAG TPA: TetR/AcrR family transcriptional regulator [Phycisphaerales bacterium]|nr:TetR/AcrR family transcriptional regulator [Phycisphaerales bacterium]